MTISKFIIFFTKAKFNLWEFLNFKSGSKIKKIWNGKIKVVSNFSRISFSPRYRIKKIKKSYRKRLSQNDFIPNMNRKRSRKMIRRKLISKNKPRRRKRIDIYQVNITFPGLVIKNIREINKEVICKFCYK